MFTPLSGRVSSADPCPLEVIPIDDSPGPSNPAPLTSAWCRERQCGSILTWSDFNQVPSFSTKIVSVGFQEPEDYLDPSDLHSLKYVPYLDDFQEMRTVHYTHDSQRDVGKSASKKAWMFINGKALTADTIRCLPQVLETVSLLRLLRGMRLWLQTEVSSIDPRFATSFMALLERSSLDKEINLFGSSIRISDTLRFANEEWLGETCLDSILSFYNHQYGNHERGRCLFLPMHFITSLERYGLDELTFRDFGGDLKWKRDELQRGIYSKVYAVVPMGGHWGAISVDLKRHTIAFGDSMNDSIPVTVVDGVVQWLMYNLPHEEEEWGRAEKSVKRLPVVQQTDGGSCGNFAALALELDVIKWQQHSHPFLKDTKYESQRKHTADFHRARFLKMIITDNEVTVTFNFVFEVVRITATTLY
jgi:hypothetical protein